jgi:hypothetical protein
MNSLKRDITSGLAMSAVALVFALAYGSPFISPRAAHADGAQPPQVRKQMVQDKNQQAQAAEAKTKPHPGTVGHVHGR